MIHNSLFVSSFGRIARIAVFVLGLRALFVPVSAAGFQAQGIPSFDLNSMAVSPDGTMAAVSLRYHRPEVGTVYIYSLADGHLLKTITGYDYEAVVFSPDSKILALRPVDDHPILVDVATGKSLAPLPLQSDGDKVGGEEIAFSRDGRYFVACDKGRIAIVDLQESKIVSELDTETGGLHNLAISPNAEILMVEDARNDSYKYLRSTGKHTRWRFHVDAFRPDGKETAALELINPKDEASDKKLVIRSWPDGRIIRSVMAKYGKHSFDEFAYSPDGKLIALGGNDEILGLFSPASGKLDLLDKEKSGFHFPQFGSAGKQIIFWAGSVSGTDKRAVEVFDIALRKVVLTIPLPPQPTTN